MSNAWRFRFDAVRPARSEASRTHPLRYSTSREARHRRLNFLRRRFGSLRKMAGYDPALSRQVGTLLRRVNFGRLRRPSRRVGTLLRRVNFARLRRAQQQRADAPTPPFSFAHSPSREASENMGYGEHGLRRAGVRPYVRANARFARTPSPCPLPAGEGKLFRGERGLGRGVRGAKKIFAGGEIFS